MNQTLVAQVGQHKYVLFQIRVATTCAFCALCSFDKHIRKKILTVRVKPSFILTASIFFSSTGLHA